MTAKDAAIVARWTVRLHIRERLLARARRQHDTARINLRERQVADARAVIARHTRRPLRERAFAEAVKDLGIVETNGNNRGADVERIIRANGGVPGEPWCGDSVAYWYLKAGAKTVVRAWAAVRLLEQLLTRVAHPRRGHVVIYNWNGGAPDHTGLFDAWKDKTAGWFWAIEGNTGDGGNTSDGNGADGVRRRLRHVSEAQSWRRVLR